MNAEQIEGIYELSPMQQGMLFHSLYAPGTGVYVVQLSFRLRGRLNEDAWRSAWQEMMDRHPILRTGFFWEELEKPLQVVFREVSLPWSLLDWRGKSADDQERELLAWLEQDQRQGFDLSSAPLLRATLIRLKEREHQFALTFHHLLLDGWSLQLVLQEFWSLYEAKCEGRELALRPPRRFEDFILWLQEQDLEATESFWRERLRGFTKPNRLEVARECPKKPDEAANFRTSHFYLSQDLTHRLQSFAKEYQLTLNTVLQGAWAILLSRYCDDQDVLFGVTVSGRPPELIGVEGMVGMFINTLPMRVNLPDQAPLHEWLTDLQRLQTEMTPYEFSPLQRIHEWSEAPRDQPLFETLLVFENFPAGKMEEEADEGSLQLIDASSTEQTNLPLTLMVYPDQELALHLLYDDSRFDEAGIERLAGHLKTLLQQVANHPDRPLSEMSVLNERERNQLLTEWNQTDSPYPRDLPLHQLFERHAQQSPDRIALTDRSVAWSYAELNRRANQIAHHLRGLGIGPNQRVGLFLERSPEMIAGMLGILKAGGTYVPLDPTYPLERLHYLLRDAEIRVLLTQESLLDRWPAEGLIALCLDAKWEELFGHEDSENLNLPISATHPAYLCYTSGSTGSPKGVLVPHRGVVRLVCETDYVRFGPEEVFLQFASPSFDAATFEIWGSLLHGARLVLFPHLSPSMSELGRVLVTEQISTVFLTSGVFQQMVETCLEDLRFVRQLVTGGDVMSARHARLVRQRYPQMRLINGYGPTESTTFATAYELPGDVDECSTIPIGVPIRNTTAYVLDSHLQPVPLGVTGDLWIGGDGLANGYHQLPELTAEKFVAHPFREGAEKSRLYRTGDLARWLPSGLLEFRGRADEQVKIRGFRIELGEVESVLAEHPSVRSCAVDAFDFAVGDKRLVAYVVLRECEDAGTFQARLRTYLQDRLPGFMIPSAFVRIDHLPLTPNGKVNKRELPSPRIAPSKRLGSPGVHATPRDSMEEKLVALFEELLMVHPIGIHDPFFRSGGHSLLAIRLIARIRSEFGVELPLDTLFQDDTVERLSERLRRELPEPTRRCLIPLQPAGEQSPLFFVHPGGGGVFGYLELALALGNDRPLYGIQAYGYEDDQEPLEDLQEMGKAYVQEMRRLQPNGPYWLSGWSMGGIVALEMAACLQAEGQEVAWLGLIDSYPGARREGWTEEELLLSFLNDVSQGQIDEKHFFERTGDTLRARFDVAQQAGILPADIPFETFQRLYRVFRANATAFASYAPQGTAAHAVLFEAEGRSPHVPESASDAWKRVGRPHESYVVPGTHYTMMQSPNVEVLAERIRPFLTAK